ncbi:FHA domain-containing protein [Gloeocapsa sp. PCC 73106]|uniref:FHA domain-containing protein n=1 Tax=Gloeocapsa sp. PCC 73106 TaxID=102232 RepID=UPI0002ACB237|nr:FHA domain-containing protein [Gloeocapsa sp. PCC 73106]ELR96525.1 FHA domain-containing protein [Gloeocapsa sp. PCC 73106]
MENSQFEHILLVERDGNQTNFVLSNESFSIGRHSSNSLVIKSKVISRHHATILPFNASNQEVFSFWIIDGNEQGIVSTNGFTVNDQPCLMHQLKPGDIIVFPDNTKITYQMRDKSQKHDSDEDIPTGIITKPEKIASKDNQFKVKTDFHHFLSSSRLETRIYVQNMTMLCLLLEKELEIVSSKNQVISLIFIFYNLNKLKEIYPQTYQKILRLYQLTFNQKNSSNQDFILSFNYFEIAVLHGVNQKKVTGLVKELTEDMYLTSKKLNLPGTEKIIIGAYSQVPQSERNIKMLIEKVGQTLQIKAREGTEGDDLFLDLNLLRLE